MNHVITTPSSPPSKHSSVIAGFLFLAALIFGIVLPIALLIWQGVTPRVAIRSGDVGSFISATGQSGFLQPAVTNVQTTHGSLIVYGLFSAPRGQPLEVVELNDEGGMHLCDVGDITTCLRLAATWPRTRMATRGTNSAFNFVHYGLGNSNLWTWLACGFLACIVTFITLAFTSVDSTDAEVPPTAEIPKATGAEP